ncbi:hypothetical protein fugu_015187 [Takifugu bimaculatus]|uniref:AIG1-type G domain-containing protein n=1 Tax=Takifugu bimaculatus TaxID=433685 RepID=A0A4Z2BXY7_9TELE|nr:hypothetical protein fugu_015187 [Takifugu bimaculatus]
MAAESGRVEEEAQRRFLRVKKQRSLAREKLRHVTDIRIVLLGAKGSGKTSALNTILNRPSSQVPGRTAQCVLGRGLVFGRRLTVVDTPGWWMNYFSAETSIFDRDQLILSLSLCPLGPHVFLLTVRVDRAFTETYRRAVQEHLQLLGRSVWTRVILLFTFGDWLGGTSIERCIESEGPPLTWLVESCGNRYHVVDNRTRGDGFQVRELILRIEEMLAGCADARHPGVGREVMEQTEEKMRREEERAEERRKRKERQRQTGKLQLAELTPLPELRMVLVGGRNTGKSSCGNTILSRRSFCTDGPTTSCEEDTAQVFGRSVSVLDTPGCFSLTSDLLEPACVLLLVVNVSSSFGDGQEEQLGKQLEAGGARVWSRTVVLFSHGDWLGPTSVERRIESEGAALQRLVEKCGNRYHVLDNRRRGHGAQVEGLMELIEETLREDQLDAGDHVWTHQEMSFRSRRHQPSQNSTEAAPTVSPTALTPVTSSHTGGQMAPVPPEAAGQTEIALRGRCHFLFGLCALW